MLTFTDNFSESPMSIKWEVDFLPGEVFRTCFPEKFNAQNAGFFLVHCRKDLRFRWEFGDDSAAAWGSDPVGEMHLRLFADGDERSLRWRMSFRNRSDRTLERVSAFNCLNLANTPLFRDLSLERTKVRDSNGNWVRLKDVPKTLDAATVKQFYPTLGGIDLQNHLAEAKTSGWGISD